jgi:Zn-dependent protease
MTLQHVDIVFQLIVFLFAISFHESAHAWMADRCGDPTARMLGRVSLNPIKHIDPIGTILLPGMAMYLSIRFHMNVPMLGWAKPTPVDPRNFKNPVADDILTSVVGPISNFIVAVGALLLLAVISFSSPLGHQIVVGMQRGLIMADSILVPATLFLYELMWINIMLGVFNLIPVPPLDGSHVLRHFLSDSARRAYDTMGWVGLLVLVYFGGGLLGRLIYPVIGVFNSILAR